MPPKDISTLTVQGLKAELNKAKVPFPPSASKTVLQAKLREAIERREASTVIIDASTPAARQLSYEEDELDAPFKEIDLLFKLGHITAEHRQQRIDMILDRRLNALSNGVTPEAEKVQQQFVSEYGERKREFAVIREAIVGPYDKPSPSEDLRDFVAGFLNSDRYVADAELREHFTVATRHYRHYYKFITAHPRKQIQCPNEPFVEDYRRFLGHMAAIKYFAEEEVTGSKRLGGLAHAYACKPTQLAEDLQALLKSSGTDLISEASKKKRPRELENVEPKFPTDAMRCDYCKTTTHNEADCRRKVQHQRTAERAAQRGRQPPAPPAYAQRHNGTTPPPPYQPK